jgi:hypothetical protein
MVRGLSAVMVFRSGVKRHCLQSDRGEVRRLWKVRVVRARIEKTEEG